MSITVSVSIATSLCIDSYARPVKRSSPVAFRSHDLSRNKVEKLLSGVAVETGQVATIVRRQLMFGKKSALHVSSAAKARTGLSLLLTFCQFVFNNFSSWLRAYGSGKRSE